MKHPDTAALAQQAFAASGAATHPEFIAMFPPGAIGLRTFRGWMLGEAPAMPLAQLVLREFAAGWRPALK